LITVTGGNITITNSAFNNNASYGIDIKTNGIVTVNGIDASDNSSYGMQVDGFSRLTLGNAVFARNTGYGLRLYTTKAALVTIRNIYSISNEGDGIGVYTKGVVTVSDVTALNNTWKGMWINNISAESPRAVNVTLGTFGYNGDYGITVLSKGAVTLTDVTSSNNPDGVQIDNTYGTANVTIRSSRAGTTYDVSNNTYDGLFIASKGVIAVSDVRIENNGWYGVWIDNSGAISARNVNLTRVSVAGHNTSSRHGIYIYSRGNVLLTDVSSMNNKNTIGDYHGLYINNRGKETSYQVWDGTGSVTIRSSRAGTTYDFSGNNRGSGIYILSNGVVTVSDITANKNAYHGIRIENQYATSARNVTLTRVSVTGNTATPWSRDGIYILSKGNVLLTDVSSSESDNTIGPYNGLYIDNRGGTPLDWSGTGNVTIRSSRAGTSYDFSGNKKGAGILILSNGVVAVSDVNAPGNTFRGIEVDNTYGTARNFTLTRGTFNDNKQEGVFIISKGAVTLTDVSASGNGTTTSHHGVVINNTAGTGNVTVRSSRAASYCDFSGNDGNGLAILSNGTITVRNINAIDNGGAGIDVRTAGPSKNITLQNLYTHGNGGNGIYAKLVSGTVNVRNVYSYNNGGNGIRVDEGSGRVNFLNCAFIGNGGNGIWVRRAIDAVSLRNVLSAGNAGRNINIAP